MNWEGSGVLPGESRNRRLRIGWENPTYSGGGRHGKLLATEAFHYGALKAAVLWLVGGCQKISGASVRYKREGNKNLLLTLSFMVERDILGRCVLGVIGGI